MNSYAGNNDPEMKQITEQLKNLNEGVHLQTSLIKNSINHIQDMNKITGGNNLFKGFFKNLR